MESKKERAIFILTITNRRKCVALLMNGSNNYNAQGDAHSDVELSITFKQNHRIKCERVVHQARLPGNIDLFVHGC